MPVPGGRPHLAYVPAIDGLRAVAVLSVILFHLRSWLLPGGYAGVDVFFVISGFVVTGSLYGAQFDSLRELLTYFYARRIYRIMPALIVMLITTIVLSAMFIPDAWLSSSIYDVAKTAFVGASNVTLARQTDTYFAPRSAFNPFLHTWSLGVEEQFYLLFPFVMWLRVKRHAAGYGDRWTIALVAGLSVLSLASSAALTAINHRFAFYLIPSRFWELGAGMLLCLTMHRWRPLLSRATSWSAVAMWLVAAALVGASFAIPETALFPFPLAALPVTGTTALIALAVARTDDLASTLLSGRVPVRLGKLSYSLYLWHWPIFVLFRWTVGLEQVFAAVAALILIFAIAEVSYRLVELPTRRRHGSSRNRLTNGRAVVAGLAVILGCTAAGSKIIHGRNHLSMSVTRDTAAWYPDEDRRIFPAEARCSLSKSSQAIADGTETIWKPTGCQVRTTRLFVIGDSHSLMFRPALTQYAATRGVELHAFFKSGCPFLPLNERFAQRPQCMAYWRAAIRGLQGRIRSGDILFLPSLRLDRLEDQAGGAVSAADKSDASSAAGEAEGVIDRLPVGVRVVFEAPTPLFRASAFRCADWYNRSNPACAGGLQISSAFLEQRRAPIVATIRNIAAQRADVSAWDAFPILCPSATCNAMVGGHPLFFDGDHVSGYANLLLYPSLVKALDTRSRPLEHRPR